MMKKVEIGDVLTLEDGKHVKVINFDKNGYFVNEVIMAIYNYKATDIRYCVDKRTIASNLGGI